MIHLGIWEGFYYQYDLFSRLCCYLIGKILLYKLLSAVGKWYYYENF